MSHILPKIESPTYEMSLYDGKSITFRAWTMKEEKILMIAMESGKNSDIVRATKQIIANCVLDDLDVDNLATFDVENILLNLRKKSAGEDLELRFQIQACAETCKVPSAVSINLNDVQLVCNEEHSNKIPINDEIGLIMRYPTFNMIGFNSMETTEDGFNLIISCIDKIYNKEEIISASDLGKNELIEFVESMSHTQFQKIREFLDTMPKLQLDIEVVCPKCEKTEKVTVEGLSHFFG